MLLVVLYHSVALWLPGGWFIEPQDKSTALGTAALWLNSFHVYGFVLVSGYIYAFLKFERGKYGAFGSLALNKVKRLLIPYAFTMIIWVAPWHWFYFRSTLSEFIIKYVLGCNPSQLWFLLMLFFVFIIAYFLGDMIKRRPLLGMMLSLVLYGVGVIGQSVIGNYYQIFTACSYFIFFAVGMLLRSYGTGELKRVPIIIYVIADISLFFINSVCSKSDIIVIRAFNLGILLLLHLVGALTAFMVLSKIAEKFERKTEGNYKNNRIYKFLAYNNFTIYLFHQQVIYGVITLLNGKVPPVILAAANFVIAIGISGIIAVILNKWKITRILIGQKG